MKKENLGKGKPYTGNNQDFLEACKLAEIPPTDRQFSKWRQKRGIAYKYRRKKS